MYCAVGRHMLPLAKYHSTWLNEERPKRGDIRVPNSIKCAIKTECKTYVQIES